MDNLLILLAALSVFSKNVLEQVKQITHAPVPALHGAPPPPPPPPVAPPAPAQGPAAQAAPAPKKEKAPIETPVSSLKAIQKKQVESLIANLKNDLAEFEKEENKNDYENKIAESSKSPSELQELKSEIARLEKKYKEHNDLLRRYAFDEKEELFKQVETIKAALKNYDRMANNALTKLQEKSAPISEAIGIPAAPPPPAAGSVPPPPPPPGPLTGGFLRPKSAIETLQQTTKVEPKKQPAAKPALSTEEILQARENIKNRPQVEAAPIISIQNFKARFDAVQVNPFKKPTSSEKADAQAVLKDLQENIQVSKGEDRRQKQKLFDDMSLKFK